MHAAPTAALLDPTGAIGRLYEAKTTPHMFVIDPTGKLIYQGAIDDKPTTDQADLKGAHNYLNDALNAAMSGKPVPSPSPAPTAAASNTPTSAFVASLTFSRGGDYARASAPASKLLQASAPARPANALRR